MDQPNAVASIVGLAMENAIAPLVAQNAALAADVADLRQRVAACETRDPVPGPPGRDGRDGVDGPPGAKGAPGIGFDDLAVTFDGDRTITLEFVRGDVRKTFPIVLPFLRYVGVFAHGMTYSVGDVVTHGGSAWHCQASTARAPIDGGADWKLIVKRGRDGREGRRD